MEEENLVEKAEEPHIQEGYARYLTKGDDLLVNQAS